MNRLTWSRAAIVFVAFVGLALVQAWPLPLHLGTHVTGPPSGDTGVYIWNTWVFRHELLDHSWPMSTATIFAGGAAADLGSHNYTLFADLIALPLQQLFSVLVSFNLIYLLNIALAGFGMFLLARRVTVHDTEAWMAGALFACSGFLVGRATGHFSLVAAAPLPIFVWCLLRCWERRRTRDGLALGLTAAWAITADPYYAVYCLMLGLGFLASRVVSFRRIRISATGVRRVLTVGAVLVGSVIVGQLVSGGGTWHLGPIPVSMRSLYTPVFVLTLLLVVRTLLTVRLRWSTEAWPSVRTAATLAAATVFAGLFVASPMLASRVIGEAVDAPPIFWRTGPQGADLLALLLPHATHPLMPDVVRGWLSAHPGGLIEQSASLSLVALLVIAGAIWRTSWRPSRTWAVAAVAFALMSMGPFIYVAGVQTHVPTPWALLRYVPLIGEARMPSRIAIVAMMAVAMLFAGALTAWTTRHPRHRRWILLGVAACLWIDLMPAPRAIFAAGVPSVYMRIAEDPAPVSVLSLPTGVRDGLSSLGNFSAHSQFYQTVHGKPIIGGYLSRTTPGRKRAYQDHPVLGPLVDLSEGRPVSQTRVNRAKRAAAAFLESTALGYVVFNHKTGSAELERFAVEVLGLRRIQREQDLSLYVPTRAQ
jgi:hypothetical protein